MENYKRLTKAYPHYEAFMYELDCNGCCFREIDCNKSHCLRALMTRLGYFEDKLEQGLLLELPCKIGDIIYHVVDKCNFINSCGEYDRHICGRPYCNAFIRKEKFTINMLNRIGKDIFLIDMETEAQTKLAELRGKKQ